MKHDFNHKAETFDSPKNIFLANLVCQAVEKQIDLLSDKEILDFGGGTGLLTLPLAKQAKSVNLAPSQAGQVCNIGGYFGENAGASSFESGAARHQEYPFFGARFTGKTLEARV